MKKFYNYDDYAEELRTKLRFALERAKELIIKTKEKRVLENKYHNKSNLNVGDLVLIKVGNRKKNHSPYSGPYKIVERNDVNSTIDYNGTHKIVHNNNLKKYTSLNI